MFCTKMERNNYSLSHVTWQNGKVQWKKAQLPSKDRFSIQPEKKYTNLSHISVREKTGINLKKRNIEKVNKHHYWELMFKNEKQNVRKQFNIKLIRQPACKNQFYNFQYTHFTTPTVYTDIIHM